MEFEFRKAERIKVKFDGREFDISPPTMGLQLRLEEDIGDPKSAKYQAAMLDQLGFPEDVIKELTFDEIARFFEFLTESLKKK